MAHGQDGVDHRQQLRKEEEVLSDLIRELGKGGLLSREEGSSYRRLWEDSTDVQLETIDLIGRMGKWCFLVKEKDINTEDGIGR